MYLTQTKAKLQLGQALVLRIDPRKVTHHAGSKFPISRTIEQKLKGFPKPIRKGASQLSTRYHPFILADDALPPVTPIELLEKDRRVKDLLSSSHYSDSLWYQCKRSINPVLADGFVFRKQRQKLASSSTAAALRSLRRSVPQAGV
ncbi:hypothetical protein, partial [Stutzerimonas stutzeri]